MNFFKKLWGGLTISGYSVEKEPHSTLALGWQLRNAFKTNAKKEASALTAESDQRLKVQASALSKLSSQLFCKVLGGIGQSGKLLGFIIQPVEFTLLQRLKKQEELPDYEAKLIVYRLVRAYEELDQAGLVCWGITPDTIFKCQEKWKFVGLSFSISKEGSTLKQKNEAISKRELSIKSVISHLLLRKKDRSKYLGRLQGDGPCESDLSGEDRVLATAVNDSLDAQSFLKLKWFKDMQFQILVKLQQLALAESPNEQSFYQGLFQGLAGFSALFLKEHILPSQLKTARSSAHYRHCGLTISLQIVKLIEMGLQQFQEQIVPLLSPAKQQNAKVLYATLKGLYVLEKYMDIKSVKNVVQQLCKRVSQIQSKAFTFLLLEMVAPCVRHLAPVTIQKLVLKRGVGILAKGQGDKPETQSAIRNIISVIQCSFQNKIEIKYQLVLYGSLQKLSKRLIQLTLGQQALSLFKTLLKVQKISVFVRKVFPVMIQAIYGSSIDPRTLAQFYAIYQLVGQQIFKESIADSYISPAAQNIFKAAVTSQKPTVVKAQPVQNNQWKILEQKHYDQPVVEKPALQKLAQSTKQSSLPKQNQKQLFFMKVEAKQQKVKKQEPKFVEPEIQPIIQSKVLGSQPQPKKQIKYEAPVDNANSILQLLKKKKQIKPAHVDQKPQGQLNDLKSSLPEKKKKKVTKPRKQLPDDQPRLLQKKSQSSKSALFSNLSLSVPLTGFVPVQITQVKEPLEVSGKDLQSPPSPYLQPDPPKQKNSVIKQQSQVVKQKAEPIPEPTLTPAPTPTPALAPTLATANPQPLKQVSLPQPQIIAKSQTFSVSLQKAESLAPAVQQVVFTPTNQLLWIPKVIQKIAQDAWAGGQQVKLQKPQVAKPAKKKKPKKPVVNNLFQNLQQQAPKKQQSRPEQPKPLHTQPIVKQSALDKLTSPMIFNLRIQVPAEDQQTVIVQQESRQQTVNHNQSIQSANIRDQQATFQKIQEQHFKQQQNSVQQFQPTAQTSQVPVIKYQQFKIQQTHIEVVGLDQEKNYGDQLPQLYQQAQTFAATEQHSNQLIQSHDQIPQLVQAPISSQLVQAPKSSQLVQAPKTQPVQIPKPQLVQIPKPQLIYQREQSRKEAAIDIGSTLRQQNMLASISVPKETATTRVAEQAKTGTVTSGQKKKRKQAKKEVTSKAKNFLDDD